MSNNNVLVKERPAGSCMGYYYYYSEGKGYAADYVTNYVCHAPEPVYNSDEAWPSFSSDD